MDAVSTAPTELVEASSGRCSSRTDGLLEATRGDTDEFFGDAELARVVAEVPQSEDLSRAVLRAHRGWIGENTPLSDDVTLVVVECLG